MLNRAMITLAALALLHSPLHIAHAATPPPTALEAGDYTSEGGHGRLTITRTAAQTRFAIDESGANGHSCTLDGVVHALQSKLQGDVPGRACVVSFAPTPQGITVTDNGAEGCRDFCGARAMFGGEYLRLPTSCTRAQQQASRKNFNALYRAKSYEAALAVLDPLLTQCTRTQNWMADAAIRNDIAITQYHLGRRRDCLKTLNPVLERAAGSEAELKELLPPVDFESFLPIAKAAWHNRKLCSAAP